VAGEAVIVADASVVVKWFVEEEFGEQALALRDDYRSQLVDIASVELLPFEVLNALRNTKVLGVEEIKTVARALDDFLIALHPLIGELAERSVDNAFRHGISIYDSSYLSLGEIMGAPVYTADRRLVEKADGQTLRHLSEYKLA